ncbi:MAG: serine/threonine-protein kinase [Polyangiaceae bacterium]
MSDPHAPPSQSLVAGKYQLGALIGRGGMGSVWEGRHVSLGTRVAVKFIEKEYADSSEARTRFLTEARAAATIQSKYAVQIFDHGVTDDGRPYIVMELLEGEGLDRRLERLGRLPLTDVARTFLQVCRALQRAHEGGIIHRDLKPENIFLQRSLDDDDEVAKVLDFGIAKIRNVDGTTLSSSTKTGAVLGTPYYMAPEQARGLREIDHRADLWSLGVIAFKCATGVLPFDGQSLGDLLVKICTSPVPVPSQIAPGLPPAFDAWFAKALDREPALRFSSANELADALAFAAGLSVKRGPNSLSNPQSAPAGGAVAAARTGDPSGGAMGAAPNITPMNASTPQFAGTSAPFTATSPGATKRSNAGVVIGMAVGMLVLGAGGVTAYTVLGRRAAPAATGTPSATPAPPPPSALPPTPTVVVGNDTIAPLPTASTPALGAPPNGARGRTRPGPKPTGSTTAALPPPLPKPGGKTDPKTEPEPKPVKTEPKPEPKPTNTSNANPGF